MAGGHRHVDSKGKAGAEEDCLTSMPLYKHQQRTIYSSEQEEGEKRVVRSAPLKNHTAQWIRAEKNAKT
ncbi:hypothetical protein OsJ_35332 [Oryza sativa Japonica Group]|uniref:Uncharacterized protein n=1 Tax=Oryza sativa subsp. japonica TaxID=39947 RepID=B9GC13_ORYSJ|nr:hypothetical protein OsJ_35332 [Oryza sativa Japonica Group]